MKRSGRPRKKDAILESRFILEGRPFFSPEAQLKPWISDSPGKRFQPEPKKPRLKMDATLSRFLVFGLAPGTISGSDRIHKAMSALGQQGEAKADIAKALAYPRALAQRPSTSRPNLPPGLSRTKRGRPAVSGEAS
jgi:hypothetical protein